MEALTGRVSAQHDSYDACFCLRCVCLHMSDVTVTSWSTLYICFLSEPNAMPYVPQHHISNWIKYERSDNLTSAVQFPLDKIRHVRIGHSVRLTVRASHKSC